MSNRVGVVIDDTLNTQQVGPLYPTQFYLDYADGYVKYNGTPISGFINYLSAFDTTTQTPAAINTAYPIGINTVVEHDTINITAGNIINFPTAGVYNFQLSLQLVNTDNQIHDAVIWLKKNGTNVADTAGWVSVPNSHGGTDGHTIVSWNYILTLIAGDTLQLYWQINHLGMSLQTIAAGANYPVSPSVIVTVSMVK
jgi:hypothetical protein